MPPQSIVRPPGNSQDSIDSLRSWSFPVYRFPAGPLHLFVVYSIMILWTLFGSPNIISFHVPRRLSVVVFDDMAADVA